jgi:hypothetical protein
VYSKIEVGACPIHFLSVESVPFLDLGTFSEKAQKEINCRRIE